MLHQVLRRFSAEGRILKMGDLVETSHWRNERLLLEHRFIGRPSEPPHQVAAQAVVETKAEQSVEAISVSESPAANPLENLPKALQAPPRPKVPVVPVVGRVPVAKDKG